MRKEKKSKDPDVKPTVGFTLPRVGDAAAAGCGASRLLGTCWAASACSGRHRSCEISRWVQGLAPAFTPPRCLHENEDEDAALRAC